MERNRGRAPHNQPKVADRLEIAGDRWLNWCVVSRTGLARMKLRPLAAASSAALILLSTAAPAFAVCALCNASVRFDTDLASCFQSRVDTELQRLQSEGRGFVIVDLSDCEATPGRGGLPTGAAAPEELSLDSWFVADGQALNCLRDAIAQNAAELDPSFLFDLTRLCP